MQSRSEETRAKITQAAEHLFSLNGYEATSVAEICELAGVSKGAFYHHFPTKQAVFMQLLDNWLAVLDDNFQIAQEKSSSIPEAFVQMAGMLSPVFAMARKQAPILLEFWTQSIRDPHVWQATIAPYRRYQTYIANLIRKGTAEGSLEAVDPNDAARMVIGCVIGLLLQSLLDPDGAAWEQVASESMSTLMKTYQRRLA